ncbi:DUF4197 domain-containing protein [Saccharicrinis aurantiacus]|uniref:DUF4197 domain-containing protein n=1 Tax=Saccharicrinis aurantiacus TaxID=1849719 RepID=UPI00094FE6F9|nr:DUF4197 domain-containing protein [Saccharicrinis aurantiacus]
MKLFKTFTIALLSLLISSCAELQKVAQSLPVDAPLSEADVSAGLKEALKVGTDSAVNILGATDGYFKDDLVKILLPPEANIIIDNASKVPGGQKLIDDVILNINRAAEDAAKEATPIFMDAIKEMTITDAMTILNGEQNAATEYFKSKSYQKLFELYQPKIHASLSKDLVAGVSAKNTWDTLTKNYNKIAGSFFGQMADLKTVETEIDKYLTQKALDGLFLKLSEEEAKIRQDPAARVTDILKKVFK